MKRTWIRNICIDVCHYNALLQKVESLDRAVKRTRQTIFAIFIFWYVFLSPWKSYCIVILKRLFWINPRVTKFSFHLFLLYRKRASQFSRLFIVCNLFYTEICRKLYCLSNNSNLLCLLSFLYVGEICYGV